ncbi:MAG: polynucleotide adenylyltransferase PcnB [Deltaproteobacteria bacterium]|nr:polynucleotide adenylyltransferase PcnB [Deltaproteobacteria bacterium]
MQVDPTIYREKIPFKRLDLDAVSVVKRLNRAGHIAYLVGGSVRDLLLGRKPKDFDIATSARPTEVRRLFRNCRLIGRRFRLAHILFANGKIIEVATFRRNPEEGDATSEPTRHASRAVNSTREKRRAADASQVNRDGQDLLIRRDNTYGDPHEDAVRRDFTINGLFYDIQNGQVIDYVGGVQDLRKRVVRTIGRADLRFREDPIRILRAIKFCTQLDFGIIPEVYDAMVDQRLELRRSAPPRLLEDTMRLLRSGAAHRAVYLAWDVGVLGMLFPDLTAFLEDNAFGDHLLWNRLIAIDNICQEGRLPSDSVLLAALLLEPIQEVLQTASEPDRILQELFENLTRSMALPRRMKDRINRIVMVQNLLQQGKLRGLMQRDFYFDAVSLFELQCLARGVELPEWISSGAVSERPARSRSRRKSERQ